MWFDNNNRLQLLPNHSSSRTRSEWFDHRMFEKYVETKEENFADEDEDEDEEDKDEDDEEET